MLISILFVSIIIVYGFIGLKKQTKINSDSCQKYRRLNINDIVFYTFTLFSYSGNAICM